MNKKLSVGVCISLIAISCTVTFVVTWTFSLGVFNSTIPGVVERDEVSAKISEIDSYVRNNYLYEVDEAMLSYGIFSGYISGLDDKNNIYMTADEHARYITEKSGRVITCGIVAEPEQSGYVIVTDVYADSSADVNEIVKGDIIVTIGGISVREIGAETALKLLDGEDNTSVVVTIRREGVDTDYPLLRRAIDVVSVAVSVEDGVGYIRILKYNELTAEQFEAALRYFGELDAAVTALMLDVRGSYSSYYEPAAEILSCIITPEKIAEKITESADTTPGASLRSTAIAYAERKGGIRQEFVTRFGEVALTEYLQTVPFIILTDSDTSGVAELLAASIKEYANGVVIGENTAGNSELRPLHSLKDGSAIRIAVARIITASGADYYKVGVTPDYAVEYEGEPVYVFNPEDPQIRKALEVIETIKTAPTMPVTAVTTAATLPPERRLR